jgi:antitoxin ParD1/3/4
MRAAKGLPMNVSLTPHLEDFIRQKVETGRYNNASEVVREALRLLDDQDRQLAWFRTKMADAEAQVRSGQVHEDTDEFWEELDREVDERLARGDQPNPDVCP